MSIFFLPPTLLNPYLVSDQSPEFSHGLIFPTGQLDASRQFHSGMLHLLDSNKGREILPPSRDLEKTK